MKRSVWMSASAAVALSVVPVGTAAADEGSGPISAAEQATSPSSDAKADLPADPEPKTPAPAVPDPRGETPAPIPDPVPSLDPVPISVAGDDASGTDQQKSDTDTDSAAAQQNNSADPDEQGQGGQDAVSGSDDDPVQQEPQIGGPQGAEEAPAAPEEAPAQGVTAVSREQASVSHRGGANRSALAQTGAGTTAAWMALGTGAAGAAMLMVRRRLAY